MTPEPTSRATPSFLSSARGRALAFAAPALLAALGVAAGALALHLAGPWGVAALATAAGLAAAAHRRYAPQAASREHDAPAASLRDAVLAPQVVPVWQRNVEAARLQSERSMEGLLESFSRISMQIDQALGMHGTSPVMELGAIDKVLAQHQPLLDRLLGTTHAAVAAKDEMLRGVQSMSESLQEMVPLAKQVQNIARATHLLALNASVEAARAGNGSGGFSVVAEEVQRLAAQSRQAGLDIGRHVVRMQERASGLRHGAGAVDTGQAEVALQAEEAARDVVSAVVESLSQVTRNSRSIRNAGKQVQVDLERIFVGLQSQDRLSQMLCAVTADMQRFAEWADGRVDDASAASARLWLERLEATYPMEELRSSHHDTANVEAQGAVEFF